MKVICSSEESLYRPEAVRWRQRMKLMKPYGNVIAILPCSMKKPYSQSKSHQKFKRATKGYQEVIVTSPFGICPREMENTFPIQSYDTSVTGNWSQDEKKEAGQLLREYIGNTPAVANVSGGYEETCREYLDGLDITYTCVDNRPTNPDSIYNTRMELKKYEKMPKRGRMLHELRSIARYQFGEGGEKLIPDDIRTKGRYHRIIYYNNKQLAFLNRDIGLYTLSLAGGEILANEELKVVEIDFNLETNTVFSPGVAKADHNILPRDEVVIVKDGEVLGTGKAIISGEEMEKSNYGVAVDIKHRKK
ncbi:MAG: DUF5591 domain-containing protein [Methanobrevibacter sp.]